VVDRDVEGVLSLEIYRDVSRSVDKEVSAVVDVTIGVSADDDRLVPALDESGDILNDDGFPEDGSIEEVPDGAVRALPHLFKLELFNTSLVGGDGGTLDADLALLNSFGGIEGDFVVSFISVLDAEVEVLNVEIEERMNQLVFNVLPEDSGHLITVQLGHGVGHLDFLGGETVSEG
jgi:hypothetical protein